MRTRVNKARGSSLVELALLLPLFGMLALSSHALGELALARLKLQEINRFLAWELTRHTLSSYGTGENEQAFETAKADAETETRNIFANASSEDLGLGQGWALDGTNLNLSLTNRSPGTIEVPEVADAAVFRAPASLFREWKLNLNGEVEAQAHLSIRGTAKLGSLLPNLELAERLAVIVDGWALSDGADALIAGGRAGNHRSGESPSGLYLQVKRMHLLGAADLFEGRASLLKGLTGALSLAVPQLLGTFVVSHNYGPLSGKACEGIPSYPDGRSPEHDARGGLSNLNAWTDAPRPTCFDTAPFRDTEEYKSSLYAVIFSSRGPFFMACQNPQADDPSSPRDSTAGDRVTSKTHCEVNP